MSSIALPALDIKPVQQPDPIGGFEKLMALRSMQQQQQMGQQQIQGAELENQVRQRQVQDQQAMTAAMQQWDGKDINELPGMILKHGGSAQAVMGMKSQIVDYSSKLATLSKDQLANEATKNDVIAGHIDNVKSLPVEQQPQAFEDAKADLVKRGYMDPQAAQQMQYQGPQQLDTLEKMYQGHSAQVDQALKTAQTTEAAQKGNEAQAGAAQKRQESEFYTKSGIGAPGVAPETAQMVDWLRKNPSKTPSDYVVWKAQHSPVMMMQGGTSANDPMVDMVGQGRTDLATAVQRMSPVAKQAFMAQLNAKYPDYNQANFGVEKKEQEAFTSGPQGQQLTAIDTARQHMQTFKQTADALHNGDFLLANKVGQALGVQFGNDAATNFQIARTAFAGEVGKAFAGANVGEGDRQELLNKINQASSPEQLKGYADTADKLLAGKQTALKKSYDQGSQGKPNFGGSNPSPSGFDWNNFAEHK